MPQIKRTIAEWSVFVHPVVLSDDQDDHIMLFICVNNFPFDYLLISPINKLPLRVRIYIIISDLKIRENLVNGEYSKQREK